MDGRPDHGWGWMGFILHSRFDGGMEVEGWTSCGGACDGACGHGGGSGRRPDDDDSIHSAPALWSAVARAWRLPR